MENARKRVLEDTCVTRPSAASGEKKKIRENAQMLYLSVHGTMQSS